jgi:hypothetical protein
LERGKNPDVFGKPASDWTDQDISEAISLYFKCENQIDARMNRGPRAATPDTVTMNIARQHERALREIVTVVRDRVAAEQRQEAAQQAQEAAMAIRKQKMADDAARRSQEQLAEQTMRDKAAATEAARRAEAEEPKIAEAVKQAEDARKTREAAERRLAEVRSKIDAEDSVAKNESDQARMAEVSRQQVLRQDAERKADAGLPSTCNVSLDQFNKASFGMQLREINQLFGCQGRQTSSTRMSGYGVLSTYAWDGNTDISVVTGTFKGNSLQSKAQMGLE